MDNLELKKILQSCADNVGFKYCKKNFYYSNDNLIIVINTQKSNYDNSYYINFGFLVKEINSGTANPKINECDVMGRFIHYNSGKEEFDFQLDKMESESLINSIIINVNNIIMPVINHGIYKYFELYPKAIITAKRNLKEYIKNKIF